MKVTQTIIAAAMLLAASTLVATAQVGINTVTPDSTALLDVRYSGAGKAVGVLLPDLSAGDRATKKDVSKGMLVFDRAERQLYYFDGSEWVAANPLVSVHTDAGFTDVRPQNTEVNQQNMSLGLPLGEAATAKLDVNGSTRVRQNLKVDGSDTVAGNAIVRQSLQVEGRGSFAANVRVAGTDSVNKLVANSSVVNGNSEVTGTLTVAETLTAGTLAGHGTIPVGGIIMWSGTTPPDGWALCTGQTSNGKATPNLQGKFIVGYQSNDADYNSIGKTGGEKKHALTIDEMPSHSHTIANITRTSGGGTKTGDKDWHENRAGDTISSGSAGGGAAHENRPPYYVLAFIMRVK